MPSQLHLLKARRFFPLFATQFLGAFNDNVFKNALIILITYYTADEMGVDPGVLVIAASAFFILPFFLLSSLAGQWADKFEKSALIRKIKLVEIFLMVAAAVGFYIQSVYFLMAVLFMMGVQSTFFGPLKYAILPDHLRPEEIIAGNAIIGTGTFISILLGTILGGVLGGTQIVSVILIALAVLGWIASFRIPNALPPSPDLRVNYNVFVQSVRIIREAFRHRDVLVSILGISWFWLVGFVFLAQFPVYSKEIIGGDQYVATAFLAMFTIGIGLGALACNILVRGRISTKYSPAAILAMSLAIVFLWGASQGTPPEDGLMDIAGFFSEPRGWAVSLGLILIAAFGGIYIVPLYALVQTRSEIGHRSRTIAANNIINAFFMVGGSLAVMILLAAGLSVTDLFLLLAVLSLPIAWMIRAGT